MNVPPLMDAAWRQALVARLQQFEARALPLDGLRAAAVALPLVEAGLGPDLDGLPNATRWSAAPALLLTRRAGHLRAHAGQWAWPGGRLDAGESPEQAALRELREEVGLVLDERAVLGRLDDYITRSGYRITPVLVWGGTAAAAQPSPDEVASLHRLPCAELLRADAPLLQTGEHPERPVLRMPVGSGWIAAPTAAFLYQFREVMLLARDTRVAHFDQPRFAWR